MREQGRLRTTQERGFIANPRLSTRDNVEQMLTQSKAFTRALNPACHNLCKHCHVSPALSRLLGLGLKHCVCEKPPSTTAVTDSFQRLTRDARTKLLFADVEDDGDCNKRLRVPNDMWRPPRASTQTERAIVWLESNAKQIAMKQAKNFHSNPLRTEIQMLQDVRTNTDVIALPTDKNLGPAIMERPDCIQRCLNEHLLKPDSCQQLTEQESRRTRFNAKAQTHALVKKHKSKLTDDEQRHFGSNLPMHNPQ